MLRRTYIGVDIRAEGLRAMAVQRHGQQLALVGGQLEALAETILQPDFSEPNIHDPERLATALRNVVAPLRKNGNRIAVALPDSSGQMFVLDLESPFKSRTEGLELIRWQLKDKLPDNTSRYAIDYQVLEENDPGTRKILAAVIGRDILGQYQEALELAGFEAAVIDFHSLSLYNAYRSKIDLGQDFVLIGIDGGQLCILVFVNRGLMFCRCRSVRSDLRTIFQEINRSLVTCRDQIHGFQRLPIYLHADWEDQGPLFDAVDSAFEQSVQLLISPVSKLLNDYPVHFNRDQSSSMVAALGAAQRLIKGAI